jgi:saccharopine dehydrogenase-like NADP-dependent oxidoreductase
MRKILLIGAGKSSSFLVKYLSDHSKAENWEIIVADADKKHAEVITAKHPNCTPISFNATDEKEREQYIKDSDIVISLLPASLHGIIALDCIKFRKHLVTASYTGADIKELNKEAKNAGVLILTEMGLDPGIDHMSAKKLIDEISDDGGKVTVFKSYCGGLVAPESDDNPWNYKISWNPRNVVLAGQGTSRYLENNQIHYVPYNRLFSQTEKIKVPGEGSYDAYVNRDSLKYIEPYGLGKADTIIRGTLRHKGYCKKWNTLVGLGITDDSFIIDDATELTYKQFMQSFLPSKVEFEEFLWKNFEIEKGDKEYKAIEWVGLLSDEKIGLTYVTPAQILQKLLEKKWKLKAKDKDMVVMYHELHATKGKKDIIIQSSLEIKGENQQYTAMAKTVGLPLAIAARLILNGKIEARGVQIPVLKEIYQPVLAELETYGIKFKEKTSNKKKGFTVNFKLF